MAFDSPAAAQGGRQTRLSSLRSSADSPVAHRAGRQLGAIGGRAGPGYSPYARRMAARAAPAPAEFDDADSSFDASLDNADSGAEEPRQSTGLFGKVRSLPGRVLGLLRSTSSKTISASTSLADVRAELDDERARDEQRQQRVNRSAAGNGMARSKTTHNLAAARLGGPSSSHLQQHSASGLASSSSMSALSALGGPATGRSAHSTLVLPNSASTNGSGPSYLTSANLGRHSRAASPAMSSTSYARHRSPSPLRNGLAGSMSTFQLAQPPSPTSASAVFNPTLGSNVVSNPFGLTSRSPFTSRVHRSPSVAGSLAGRSVSSSAGASGHPLFPYSSTVQRGTSPLISSSLSVGEGLSSVAAGTKRPYSRALGSPLNPAFPASASVASGLNEIEVLSDAGVGGAERARKKQLVWDPVKGLVSRERLEREKELEAPPMPKNEAERILEVLEGMGRTPLGEAKRGAVRPKHVNVPLAEDEVSSTGRLPRSSATPSLLANTPYAARAPRLSAEPGSSTASYGQQPRQQKGLQAVLRAREDRRRALIEQEHEERERERREDEERERERERRRRDRRRRMEELMSDEGEQMEDVFSAPEDEELRSPRRVTRSSAAGRHQQQSAKKDSKASKGKGKERLLEPPTPTRRSTRASSRAQTKSPSPAPTPRKTRSSKAAAREDAPLEEDAAEDEDEQMTPAAKRTRSRSKSPAPPSRSAAKSASPPPPVPAIEAPPAVPKITFPAPSSFPEKAPSTSTGRSSLRPGKSHSSRQHASSSRVFSAKEEDLPPLNEEELSKIQMPAIKFPANFSFGATPAASSATEKKDNKKTDSSAPSLLSRLGAPASTAASAEASKPAFSFGAPAAPSAPAKSASTPSFSFGAPADKAKESATSAPDFFAKPAAAPASTAATTNGGAAKPNFFGSIIAEKEKDKETTSAGLAKPSPTPLFSFGAAAKPADAPVIKPTEVITPTSEAPPPAEKEKAVVPASAAASNPNPFAAFGKPVAEIVKEAAAEKEKEGEGQKKDEAPKPAFSFCASAEKKDEKKDAPAPLFSFGAAKTDSAASPFAFGSTAAKDADKPADKPAASPFSFGSSLTSAPAPAASTPTFTFGTTPATPKADEKKDEAPAPLFGGLSAPSAPSVTDDADGDSGMEDEGDAPAAPAAAPTPAFTFGASSGSSAPSPFGASGSTGFSFGSSTAAADKKEASPSPFGAPAGPSTLFGAAPAAPKPSFTFGASASPSPAPPSPAPASAASPFAFGSAAPAASSSAPSSFAFGATAPAANPFGAASTPASPTAATAVPSFSFGATPSPAPGSPAPAAPAPSFTFGAPASSAMGPNLSTASTASAGSAAPFTFGASAPTTPGAGAAAPSPFAFGASSSSATTGAVGGPGGAAPFTFGASTSTPASPAAGAGGFTFGAPAAPSAPGTPGAGGMFNIGSGGGDTSQSTGRQIRPLRKPRRG
ncbi:hypothetical protein Rhopal_000705-T1 [Rhodotorula paludigena]|uniref:Proteophosphoglycan ppg4 n=1 Tax=Rhodotorula paludigena TaxID=86838 RepID=A0AAV5GDL5_9BASI|nr:hypothetical protein Rhopal_000705-T1 [Rhodotorula paludigena]